MTLEDLVDGPRCRDLAPTDESIMVDAAYRALLEERAELLDVAEAHDDCEDRERDVHLAVVAMRAEVKKLREELKTSTLVAADVAKLFAIVDSFTEKDWPE